MTRHFGTSYGRLIDNFSRFFYPLGEAMNEPAAIPMAADVAALCERARRARAEAQRLSSDYHFILSWYRMRPGSKVRPSPLLDE